MRKQRYPPPLTIPLQKERDGMRARLTPVQTVQSTC